MTEEEIVEFLTKNIDYFDTNNLVTWFLRELGWLLVKGFNIVIDVLKNLYNHTFGLVDITNSGVLKNFLAEYNPLIKTIMILSLVIVGYMFLFGKDKKHDVFTSLMIFAVVITSSSYLFGTFNTMSIMFKDAVTGSESVTDGYELVNQNLYDLLYIDENGGLIQMNGNTPPQYAENSLDKKDMKMIDITETLDYSRDGLTNEAEEILSKRLEYASDESRLIDVYNGAMWTSFGNTFYYRYQFNFGTYFLLAIASIFVFVGLGCKNIKIVYELFVGRILATLFSGDLTGKRKMVRILEAIRDGYYALCFTAITLRSFFLFSDYITGRNFGGLERGIMILILAFVVVDGANLMDANIFDLELFNILSLSWDDAVTNGAIMKKLWEEKKIALEDVAHTILYIDESHRSVNAQKPYALDLLSIYLREGPKYFSSIWLASQSIRDYVPEGSTTENIEKLKLLFELTQYKFIFKQDRNVIPLIDRIFGNALTPRQRERIPLYSRGQTTLLISGRSDD